MPHLLPPFTRAVLRRPAANFAAGITSAAHLGAPDFKRALRQYESYIEALRGCGLELTLLPADERFPDGHFVEDAFVIFRDIALRCRSGAPARQGEGDGIAPALKPLRLLELPPAARLDGGDVLFCADRVLVGISQRSNQAGYQALRAALQTRMPAISVDAVPFAGVLHLKSGLTELAPGTLIRDPALKTAYDLSWARVITLPPAEGFAADVLPINDTVFVAAGCPTALAAAREVCPQVETLDLSEFVKMDGGLTCLSLRW